MATVFETLRNWFLQPIVDAMGESRYEELGRMERRRDYRQGRHDPQLKVKSGQHDDNMTLNFGGLVIKRSNSLLFGKPIQFDLPGDEATPESEYIDAVWEANKQGILLRKVGIFGGEQGTCYIKIIPDGVVGQIGEENKLLPRLSAIDPAFVTVDTNPEDDEEVRLYRIEYVYIDENGNKVRRRQDIEKNYTAIMENDQITGFEARSWTITDKKMVRGSTWEEIGKEEWPFDFPPMHHWQNLPEPGEIYGAPDVTEDVLDLQDDTNMSASNINKIIRLYAHPQRYAFGITNQQTIEIGPDNMPSFPDKESGMGQLEPLGDLAAAQQFLLTLRQALFDITQTVDISSLADKLGALTNFGLRVLYQDALAKLDTKRELYGDALLEINRRLLVLGKFANTDPGRIVWTDPLPANAQEKITEQQFELDNGIKSKQTIATERGVDWENEQERLVEDQTTAEDAGTRALRAFLSGGGA